YLAVSDSQQRGRFLRAFYKGDTAPVLEGVVDEQGNAIYGRHPGWIWYADRGVSVLGLPGAICARSGRWFARVNMIVSYDDGLSEVIRRRAGEPLPPSQVISEGGRDMVIWEWIGV
ncbi:hypothetical protein DWU98_19415, partial [Dyella monticola]